MIDQYGAERLVELTDRADPPEGEIDDTILQKALDDADAVINSYVARRYDMPITGAPPVLRRHAEVLAWYSLHRGRHTEEDRQAYDDTMKFLDDVSKGVALLDVGGSQPASSPAEAVVDGPDRMFNRDTLKGL